MRKIYYIFLVFLIIVVGVEFRISEKEILKRLRKIVDKFEMRKELI